MGTETAPVEAHGTFSAHPLAAIAPECRWPDKQMSRMPEINGARSAALRRSDWVG